MKQSPMRQQGFNGSYCRMSAPVCEFVQPILNLARSRR